MPMAVLDCREALKKVWYSTVQLEKWDLGDKPENFPTSNSFDEMYDMLLSYACVYRPSNSNVGFA